MNNVVVLPQEQWDAWLAGYRSGRIEGLTEGFERGYKACDDEISTLQRAAATIVHAMADVPVRDHAEDERQAARRADWWAERRGEVGTDV